MQLLNNTMKIIITEEQKKKLFIPRRQSGEDSKWNQWNKEQPVKDGVRINQYTHDGLKTGIWESYYRNGNLYSKGLYINGKKEGIWGWYHPNGNIESKGPYKDGKEDGLWEIYYENGNLSYRGSYKNGKEEGIWEWYYGDGNLSYRGSYKDGEINKELPLNESEQPKKKKLFIPRRQSGENSKWVLWNKEQPIKDGIRINQYDEDGLKTGYWESWIDDDMIIGKGNFFKGKKNGLWTEHLYSGELLAKGDYINDKESGIWEFYDAESGESLYKVLFNKGKGIGKWDTSKQSLDETIKASEAYSDINSFKTLEDGKRGIAWILINSVNKDIKKYILNSIKKNDFGYIVVKEHPNKPIIVYRNGYRQNAEELAKIASKYNGYLSSRATYEDSKRIGELLEYDPNDINDYLNRNYINGLLKEGKVYPYNLNINESDDDYVLYEFKNKDGFDFEVEFYKYNDVWEREYKTFQKGMGLLNTNDVYNIIETVTNITIDFIKKYQPKEVKITHIRQNKESIFIDRNKPSKRALLNQKYLKPAIDKLPNYTYTLKGNKSIISEI